jgi:CRP-like cAMP-binding protein
LSPAPLGQEFGVRSAASSIVNKLLDSLSPGDWALLEPHLKRVDLPRGKVLIQPEMAIEYTYFLEDGIASIVVETSNGHQAEAAIVGIEGLIDIATALGASQTPLLCNMQVPGHGYRMPALAFVAAYEQSETLRMTINAFTFSVVVQIAQTALANATYSIEQRLARWLLMCADRSIGEEVAMTHEFLALMLNVRRAGVTIAIGALQNAGYVDSKRALIRIINRRGLEEFAADAYIPLR